MEVKPQLSVYGRWLLVQRVLSGRPVAHVAAELGVSRATGYKWWRRWREEGPAGLRSRSCRPRTSPAKTPDDVEQRVLALRRERRLGAARDAGVLGPDLGTVARMAPGDVTVTCETALALSVWRRQSLEPAAREILGSDVVQIDHFGVYACRPVNNGRGSTRPSTHGRAAALDFAGVRLRDGRRITVAADWNGGDAEARFLRRIRDDACRIFGTTLSPDYNAVHHDHLHLEAGRPGLCS